MLLTLYNLPPHMRYADVKSLILSKCGVKEVILDNLVSDGGNSKKVTVGLAEEEDAALLVRQINGLYLEGRQLYVEDVRKKKPSDQPFRQSHNNYVSSNADTDRSNNQQSSYPPQANYTQQMSYQQSQYPVQTTGFEPDNFGNQQIVNPEQVMPVMMPYMAGMNMGGMYYMPQGQNSYMGYSDESQQLPSIANQYPQFPGQQGQTGSGLGSQNLEEDKSRERRARMGVSQGVNDNNHGIQPTYKSDTTQMSGGWAGGREMETSRRRSRSPRNKHERSRGGSGISPKRARIDEDNDRDSLRKGSNSNRESRRDTYERNKTYTSQTYGNSSQSRPYYEYNNDPVTATSSNNRPQPLMGIPTQNQWNLGTNNPKFQQQKSGGLSDSTASFKDKSQVASWDSKDTSSLDNKSNYRKHMEMKASQNQSKYTWRNPMQSSWGGQSSAPVEDKPQLEKNPWPKKPKKNKGKGKASVMPAIRQDSTSRFKAANQIASDIAKAHPDIIKTEHLKHLRQSVRSRFEILLAARVGESLPLMIAIYRAKFPESQDREFCRLIVEQAEAESKTTVDLTDPDWKTEVKQERPNQQVANNQPSAGKNRPSKGKNRPQAGRNQPQAGRNQPQAGRNQPQVGRNQPQPGRNQPQPGRNQPQPGRNQPQAGRNQPPAGRNRPATRQQTQNQYNQPAIPRLQLPAPLEKLPKYPNADKQVYKEQKKLKKLEHSNEDLYTLTPHLQQALDKELKNISDIFKRVVSNADTEQEKGLCERFLSIGLEQVRKVIKLNVTKRLLNITTNLVIRVLVSGKPPKKQEVELFLRKHKVVSMKKSDRKKLVYVATCNDFKTYDTLLQMGSAPLNHETVLRFKPFQLAGPKLSFRERNEQRLQRLSGLEGHSGNNTETAPDNYYEDVTDPIEVVVKNRDQPKEEEITEYSAEPNEEEINEDSAKTNEEENNEDSAETNEDVVENSAGLDVEIMDDLKKEQHEQDEQDDKCDVAEDLDDIDDEDFNEEDLEDY